MSSPAVDVAPPKTAVLDWENATIALPIDAYGMSYHERQAVEAAQGIVFAQCVTGSSAVAVEAVNEARRAITTVLPGRVQWLFGAWNAAYIANNGMAGREPPLDFMPTDQATARRCLGSDDVVALNGIYASLGSDEDQVRKLSTWYSESVDRTLADSRYQALLSQLADCLAEKGYSVFDPKDGGWVYIDESWDEEQRRQADLAEAQCSDGMALVQRAADIAAEYQWEIIHAHEAELLAIRQVAAARVAQAEAILREVGVL